MFYTLVVAAVVTAVAEQGDKTQMISLALAGRYRPSYVLLGVFLANLPLSLIYVVIGAGLGRLLPEFWLLLLGSLAFLVFGAFSLRPESTEPKPRVIQGYGPILVTTALLLLAQAGDHAALVTMAIASNPAGPLHALGRVGGYLGVLLDRIGLTPIPVQPWEAFVGVWLGSVLGNVLADGLAIAVGVFLGRKLPERTLRLASAAVFIVLGLVGLAALLLGRLAV